MIFLRARKLARPRADETQVADDELGVARIGCQREACVDPADDPVQHSDLLLVAAVAAENFALHLVSILERHLQLLRRPLVPDRHEIVAVTMRLQSSAFE